MIKKQQRFSPDIRLRLKIEAIKAGVTVNALVLSILKNPRNWEISFIHKRFEVEPNQCYILEYSDEIRKMLIRNVEWINELYRVKHKITTEMAISQVVETFYNN